MNMLTSLKKMVDAVMNDPRKILLVILALITLGVIAIGLTTYIAVGSYLLNESDPVLQLIEIESISLNFSNSTLEAKTSLKVGFSVPDAIRVYPEMGTFVLIAAKLHGSEGVHAFCESTYKISEHDEVLLLNFKTHMQEHLPKKLWIRVIGDFKMAVKLTALPGFSKANRHVYLLCEVEFNALRDKIVFKTCGTSKKPYNW